MRTILITIVAALAVLAGPTTPAQAMVPAGTVCIQADFPIMKSGYQIKQSIKIWNSVQGVVQFSLKWVPGCTIVHISKYRSSTDGWMAYVSQDQVYLNTYNMDGFRGVKCLMRQTIVHELGHTLGLPDLVDGGTRDVMSYHADWTTWCGVPSEYEVSAVIANYTI